MTRNERFEACVAYFQKALPNPETELNFSSTYELLVAAILSAQCTDKGVNMVTRDFFKRYPDIPSLAKPEYDDVFALIKSVALESTTAF